MDKTTILMTLKMEGTLICTCGMPLKILDVIDWDNDYVLLSTIEYRGEEENYFKQIKHFPSAIYDRKLHEVISSFTSIFSAKTMTYWIECIPSEWYKLTKRKITIK